VQIKNFGNGGKEEKDTKLEQNDYFLIECLLNDNDLSREMSREEFEKLISPLMENFFEFLF